LVQHPVDATLIAVPREFAMQPSRLFQPPHPPVPATQTQRHSTSGEPVDRLTKPVIGTVKGIAAEVVVEAVVDALARSVVPVPAPAHPGGAATVRRPCRVTGPTRRRSALDRLHIGSRNAILAGELVELGVPVVVELVVGVVVLGSAHFVPPF
jgi:hypothetical protein